MSAFDQAFTIVIGEEGGFTANRADPGNWTGGKVGVGELKGTKFGIAASAHLDLDIANLTLDQAKGIYKQSYWDKVAGDDLPPSLALLVFDAAVNSGPGQAAKWLQTSVGVKADGQIGPLTLAAVATKQGGGIAVLAAFNTQRLVYLASLPTWKTFSHGWANRLCTLPYHSVEMTQ